MARYALVTNLLGLDGSPESGGLIASVIKDTSTPVAIYAASSGSTTLTNPAVGDSLGQITGFLDDAVQYTLSAKTANGATVLWEADVVAGLVSITYVNPAYSESPIIHVSWVGALGTPLGDGWTEAFADPYPETESGIIYASDYVTVGSTADQSVQMQAALDAAAGGTLILPKATIYCKALSLPGDTAIKGQEMDSSILKLPAAANTYLMASAGWITNTAYAEYGSVLEDFEIDGNSTNQSSAQPALVLKTYQARCSRLSVVLSKGDGLVFSAANSDGSLGATNNMANNIVDQCNIVLNERVGIHGIDHSSKLADWEIKNSNIWGNGRGYASGWNVYMERSAGGQFIANQSYSPGDAGNVWLATASGTRVIGNHIDISGAQLTSGTCIGLKMDVPTFGWAGATVVGNDIFCAKSALNGTEVYKLGEFTSATSDSHLMLTGNSLRHVNNLAGIITWTSTGSLVTHDTGNGYVGYATQPDPSANISRALESNASGTWTIDQALALNASLTQQLAGGSSIFRSVAGEGSTQSLTTYYGTSSTPALDALGRARGTIASPSDVVQFDEIGRRIWTAQLSGSLVEVARDAASIREASPTSSARGANRIWSLCPDASGTITETMRLSYTVGLSMYGANVVIDADRGIRYPSYTSTALNAIANAVNTANKAAGKTVYNSTVTKLVTAVGSTAGSIWVDGAGTTINTPV